MKVKRALLFFFWGAYLIGIVLMPIAASHSAPSQPPSDIFGVAGFLMGIGLIGGTVTSYMYADELGKDPGVWAFAAFLLPCLFPFILAFLKKETVYKPSAAERKKLSISGATLTVRQGFKRAQLPLDRLRLLTLFVPSTSNRRWTPLYGLTAFKTESQIDFRHLDLLTEQELHRLIEILPAIGETLKDKSGRVLPPRRCMELMDLFKILIKDYDGNEAAVSVKDILASKADFFGTIARTRPERISRLESWLGTNPQVVIGTSLFKTGRARLSKSEVQVGKRKLSWADVQKIGVSIRKETLQTTATICLRLVEPQNRWEKSVDVVVDSKKYLSEAAEFFFWNSLFVKDNRPAADSAGYTQLVTLLNGKALCTRCSTVGDDSASALSQCCQKPVMRFRAAEKSQKCSLCGMELTDKAFGTDTRMVDLLARKGFMCPKCGRLCSGCGGMKPDFVPHACACGAPLEIRL